MDPVEAAEQVLRAAAGETLHWTVIWDRALREGLIDPLGQPGARDDLIRGLSQLARAGSIEKVAPGTYRALPDGSPPPGNPQ